MVKLTATANEHHITTKNFVKVSKGFTYYKRVDFTKYLQFPNGTILHAQCEKPKN